MLFSALSPETQEKLNKSGIYLTRHSSLEGQQALVDDVVRMADPAVVEEMHSKGYEDSSATEWFEFVTRSETDENSLAIAENAPVV